MNLKELRIGFFEGISSAEIRFEKGRIVSDGGLSGRVFRVDRSREDMDALFDALRWVLFGAGHREPAEASARPRAVQLDFDMYSIHRNRADTGDLLRFYRFRGESVPAIEDLTQETMEKTQQLIEQTLGISESDLEKLICDMRL